MTSKEALKKIRETTTTDYLGDDISIEDKLWEEIEVLEKLVERDTPKRVVFNTIHYIYECPICNDIVETEVNHCGNCGQRIDWEEENE